MRIDHIVLWVEDPLRSLAFYEQVVGLEGVRVEEFRAGRAPFPSVRVSADAIIDLMARTAAPAVDAISAHPGAAGHPVNHLCLSMSAADVAALRERLAAADIAIAGEMERSFGAQGYGRAFYFGDPDGNVLEARCYDASGTR
jgi:glyoxylase I family protein